MRSIGHTFYLSVSGGGGCFTVGRRPYFDKPIEVYAQPSVLRKLPFYSDLPGGFWARFMPTWLAKIGVHPRSDCFKMWRLERVIRTRSVWYGVSPQSAGMIRQGCCILQRDTFCNSTVRRSFRSSGALSHLDFRTSEIAFQSTFSTANSGFRNYRSPKPYPDCVNYRLLLF